MQVHLDPKIEKHLQAMRRAGKRAALAASKAEDIICRLKRGEVMADKVGSVTKHGELRIKGLIKFDLGGGYRLITYKQGQRLFLLYAGSHDDSHRWIENNRELRPEQIEERCIELPVSKTEDESESRDYSGPPKEEGLSPSIDISQKELRAVFCGLVERNN